MTEAETLTQELVRIESTNPGAQEGQIADYIFHYLSECGADVFFEEVTDGRKNVIAELEGREKEALVLICHMDTVVVGSDWTEEAFSGSEKNGRIYGRGSCDMKSGLACALTVFRRMAQKVQAGEMQLVRPLRLLCTVDEEGDMQGSEQAIRDGRVNRTDWIMDLEPTDGQIQMAHKGRLWLEVNIQGITAHASKPDLGADAIAAAAELISRIRREFTKLPEHQELGKSTVTFGKIEGGYQPYVVPDECRLWMDMRLVPPMSSPGVLEKIDAIIEDVEKEIPGIRILYDITGNRPCIEKNESSKLAAALTDVCRTVTGKEPQTGPFSGYTDTAVIAGILGNREFLSYGPGNLKMAHKPDEYVETADIKRCEAVLTELVETICCGE